MTPMIGFWIKMKEFTHFCVGCKTPLKASYSIQDNEVVIECIDAEYNLINYCENCKFCYSDNQIRALEEAIEKETGIRKIRYEMVEKGDRFGFIDNKTGLVYSVKKGITSSNTVVILITRLNEGYKNPWTPDTLEESKKYTKMKNIEGEKE